MVKTINSDPRCRELQSYLSGQLDLPERLLFEDHLGGCPACSDEIAFWNEFTPEIDDWKHSKTAPEITRGDIYRLVSDAAAGKKPTPVLRPTFVWSAAGACAAALALLLITGDYTGTSAPGTPPQIATRAVKAPPAPPVPAAQVAPPGTIEQLFETAVDQTLTQQMDDNTIGLASNSQVVAISQDESRTRFRIRKGTAAFKVDRRAPDEVFTVEVGSYRVEVVGTEFSVSLTDTEQIRVAVRHGAVRVLGPEAAQWLLNAGERLILGAGAEAAREPASEFELADIEALTRDPEGIAFEIEVAEDEPEAKRATRRRTGAKKRVKTEELTTLKQWLAAGDTGRALKETERYLKANPRSGPGWMLLGDCHRKQKNWTEAVEAYERTMKSSVQRLKSRAMYKAATIYQQKLGRHPQAIALYEAYIKTPTATRSLQAVARLNMAKSLIATGNKARARTLLEQVIQSQKDNYLAKNAREILSGL